MGFYRFRFGIFLFFVVNNILYENGRNFLRLLILIYIFVYNFVIIVYLVIKMLFGWCVFFIDIVFFMVGIDSVLIIDKIRLE